MTGTTLRHPGDPFPALVVNLPGGRTLHLPDDLAGRFGVVLFSRRSPVPVPQRPAQRLPAGAGRPGRGRCLDPGAVGERRGHHAGPHWPGRACGSQSVTAPTRPWSPMRPARPPTPALPSCSRPALCSTQAGGPSSARTPAPPSGGSSRKTSSASSATCADTPPPADLVSGSEPSARADGTAVYARVRDLRKRPLWDQAPEEDSPAERAAAAVARALARQHDWPTPAALDDDLIDDPAYQPEGGWLPATLAGVPQRPVPVPPAAPPALITPCRAPAAGLVWPVRGHRTSTTMRATATTQPSRQGVPHGTATA
jgi:hypothetical protein